MLFKIIDVFRNAVLFMDRDDKAWKWTGEELRRSGPLSPCNDNIGFAHQ